jgi:hypothetical protein
MYEEMIRRAGDDPKKAETRESAQVELGFIAYLERNWAEGPPHPPAADDVERQGSAARRAHRARGRPRRRGLRGRPRAREEARGRADADPEWTAAEAEFRYRTGDQKSARRRSRSRPRRETSSR